MTNDAILNARQAIRKDFSSYDNSFKILYLFLMTSITIQVLKIQKLHENLIFGIIWLCCTLSEYLQV